MFIHRYKSLALISLSALTVGACSGIALNPAHLGKYTFQGRVTSADGKPVPNAWVKARGWETLTDSDGRWKQEQVLDCGAMRDHMDSHDEADDLLVTAIGFEPHEEGFVVKHAGWFSSCQPEQTLAFDTVLDSENPDKKMNRDASKYKPQPEPSAIPWPKDDGRRKRPKGTYL